MDLLPSSRIPDPADAPPLRWGILAPGGIAGGMAASLRNTSQTVVAVGSRSLDRAQAFAGRYGIERAYGSYDELVSDPGVDAVYVASPHSAHRDQALLAIAAGKHVLVEKSFTRNAAEAREVVAAARAAGVVCVEAMWPRFAPRYDVVRQLLEAGSIGEVVTVQADHSQQIPPERAPRMYDPDRAGGALMDLGIYPVSFVSFVLGSPGTVSALGSLLDNGLDATIGAVCTGFSAAPRAVSTVTTSLAVRSEVTASIRGTEGRIELDGPISFYSPGPVRLVRPGGTVVEAPQTGLYGTAALTYEACHVAQLVADGATESPLMPLDETVAVMETMDEIRRQVGVRFPGE